MLLLSLNETLLMPCRHSTLCLRPSHPVLFFGLKSGDTKCPEKETEVSAVCGDDCALCWLRSAAGTAAELA